MSDPLVEKRTYSKIGTNTAYMALVYDGSTNLEKDIRDLIPTNIPGETFLYYNNIKIADASADYIYITIRQSGDDRATTRIRTSISPANFANAFWRKNELGNNDRYDKEDFLYTHRELGGAGDKNNRLRVVEIEGNLGTATNNSGFSEGITWTNNAITSSASTTIYRYPNIQLASDNFRTEKGERENGIWISPFDSALDAIPGQVEVYAPNLKENYKNKTIYGSDLSIFDNTSPNNYRPTALKEKYFDDFNTREISFTLKGDTGNGFKINSLYLGVYTRGDYKVKFYDHDGELIKEEIIPGSRGRIGRNTTTILQY